MKIIFILICLTLMSSAVRLSVAEKLMPVAKKLHSMCLTETTEKLKNVEILNALVCGEQLNNYSLNTLFIATGLIHLLVVSGSHLNLLNRMINNLLTIINIENKLNIHDSYRSLIQLCILFFYCLVCNFNPPIVRAFTFLCFIFLQEHLRIKFSLNHILILAGLTCLAVESTWICSLSFQMSWLIHTISIFSSNAFQSRSKIKNQIAIYLALIPTFHLLGFPPLNSIIISIVFSSAIEFILFPLSFLTYFFNNLGFIFDLACDALIRGLQFLETSIIPAVPTTQNIQINLLNWIIICSLHLILELKITSDLRSKESLI